MALRLYALRDQEAIGGYSTYRGSWHTGTPSPSVLTLDKSEQTLDGPTSVSGVTDGGAGTRFVLQSFAYPILADTQFSGTIDICFPSDSFADPSTMDPHWSVHAFIQVGTAGTLRGTLLNQYTEASGATNRLPGGAAARQLASPQAITTVNAVAGDYLIVEIGAVMYIAPANASRVLYWGTKNNVGSILDDLVTGDSYNVVVGTGAAWIELAGTPIPPPPLVGTVPSCCDATPSVEPDPTGALPAWIPLCGGGGEVDTVADLTDGEYWG